MNRQWKEENGYLVRDVKVKNFNKALNLVNEIGKIAEEMNHHPDLLIHSYNQVKISTMTHSEGKITNKDYTLAEKIDYIIE